MHLLICELAYVLLCNAADQDITIVSACTLMIVDGYRRSDFDPRELHETCTNHACILVIITDSNDLQQMLNYKWKKFKPNQGRQT